MSLLKKIIDISLSFPDKVAIIKNKSFSTYSEIIERASYYYNRLIEMDVHKNEIVCVISNSSIESISCVIGIIFAGGAYCLISPESPLKEIEDIINMTNARCVFTEKDFGVREVETIPLNSNRSRINFDSVKDRDADSLAYVVFTSGTTGRRKGIMVEDRNLIAYIDAYIDIFNVSERDVILQQSPVYYDGLAEEVFSMLCVGGTIILANKEELKNPRIIKRLCDENGVTILPSTPLMLRELNRLEQFKSVRCFISSGDVLKKSYVNNMVVYSTVYNMYGPTETTVCATCYKVNSDDDENIPIGTPIKDYHVFVLDEEYNEVDDGEIGEIYIGGMGVSRGYLRDKELTDKCFLVIKGEPVFKTGDFAYKNQNSLIYMGRKDRQVKIRGNRVNLIVIERVLEKYAHGKVIVTSIEDDDSVIIGLVAFYDSIKVEIDELVNKIKLELPNYMLPSKYIQLNEMPLTETGKVDYSYLKSVLNNITVTAAMQNETQIDKVIEIISQNVITDNRVISVSDKLSELNFNSFSFIKLVLELEESFDIEFEDEYLELEKFSTIEELCNYVKCRAEISYEK